MIAFQVNSIPENDQKNLCEFKVLFVPEEFHFLKEEQQTSFKKSIKFALKFKICPCVSRMNIFCFFGR